MITKYYASYYRHQKFKGKNGEDVEYLRVQLVPTNGGFAEIVNCSKNYEEDVKRYINSNQNLVVVYNRRADGQAVFGGFLEV